MTRSRIYYGMTLFFVILLHVVFCNRPTYAMLFTALLLPGLSAGLTRILVSRLTIVQSLDTPTVVKGQQAQYTLHVTNRTILPCAQLVLSLCQDNAYFFDGEPQLSVVLLPNGHKALTAKLRCRFRGSFSVGVSHAEVRDYLGLFRFSLHCTGEHLLTVCPRVLDAGHLLQFDSAATDNGQEDDFTTMIDHRTYQPTDPMKHIHWKLSAKSETLMVKKFAGVTDISDAVFVDLRRPEGDTLERLMTEDRIIENAVAILYACTDRGLITELIDQPLNASSDHGTEFDSFYDRLTLASFEEDSPAAAAIYDFLDRQGHSTRLWISTGQLDEPLAEAALWAANEGCAVNLFVAANSAEAAPYAARLDENNVRMVFVPDGTNLIQAAKQV